MEVSATQESSRERAELQALLASGIFHRAQALEQLLVYVCNKYFDGAADEIKEYTIAVDALGRPPDFDQKRDSVVRVQIHRLRERLAEFYRNEGAGHETQIVIPQGQYTPRFVANGDVALIAEEIDAETSAAPAHPGQNRRLRLWATGAIIGLSLAGLSWVLLSRTSRSLKPAVVRIPLGVPTNHSIRIRGGLSTGTFLDGFGHVWQKDQYYEGGNVITAAPGRLIYDTREQRLYQTGREGNFSYSIPLDPGVYELRLHFAETLFGETNPSGYGGEGTRVFGILINGKRMARLDVIGEAGASAADIKVFKDISPAPDGKLHLNFEPISSTPFINAIEITPGTPGRLRPIRIIAQSKGFTDKAGNYWEPDRYAIGGQLVAPPTTVIGTDEPELYTSGRFGNLTYIFPVPPGRYSFTMYTSERWYGPNLTGGGGPGSRLFDIFCNGAALARNFDIYERSGGSLRALVKTFNGLEPNHQGNIVISFVPEREFAFVDALELDDQTPAGQR